LQAIFSAVVACAFAKPGLLATGALGYAAPVAYAAPAVAAPVAYAASAIAAPVSVHTQYHAQDELGQASYGHAEPFQTHNAIQVRRLFIVFLEFSKTDHLSMFTL
jgi:hypothetical protein